MPELKGRDDLIIEDQPTRDLLTALLSKWGEPQASLIVTWVQSYLEDRITKGDARLLCKYARNIYNEAAERKTEETFREHVEAHNKLLDEAGIIFQHSLAEAIKMAVVLTIKMLADQASDVPINRIKDKAEALTKKENLRFQRTSRRIFREALGTALPIGAPIKYHADQVKKRVLTIMRALSAGKRDQTKVAVIFYSDLTTREINASGKARLLNLYNCCTSRHAYLVKFSGLLKKKGLAYRDFLPKSKEKSDAQK